MSKRICPWWLGYLLVSPIRCWLEDPHDILSQYVKEGMTVLEPGPGMGFFTLELGRLVGQSGRVVAVDVQPQMIAGLKRRLAKKNLADRVEPRIASADSVGVTDLANRVDFALAFAVVHEMPSSERFFSEASQVLKAGARLLLVEPSGHVKMDEFQAELGDADKAGLRVIGRPVIRRSHAALLEKS